jgi:hypothetical protein
MRLLILAASLIAVVGHAAVANAVSVEDAAVRALRADDVYVQAPIANLVQAQRLRHATEAASRAADGAAIKLAFVDVPDAELDGLRERRYARLGMSRRDALVVATPVSITMRTGTLAPMQEEAIITRDSEPLSAPPRRYTEALGELLFEVGLVIHNSTPGAVPRGSGPYRSLSTFPGRFPDETGSRPPWPFVLAAPAVALATLAVGMRRALRGARRRSARGSAAGQPVVVRRWPFR